MKCLGHVALWIGGIAVAVAAMVALVVVLLWTADAIATLFGLHWFAVLLIYMGLVVVLAGIAVGVCSCREAS